MQKKPERKYKRLGRCQPKKCGSICCRLCMGIIAGKNDTTKYYRNFGFKPIIIGKITRWFPERVCNKLALTGKCLSHKNKPRDCRVFPQLPSMGFYKVCKKLGCTYRFKEIKNAKR